MVPARPISAGARDGEGNCQGVETPRTLVGARKVSHKTTNNQKTPIDGAAQERVKRKHDRGVQEDRNWRHDPPQDRQGPGRRSRLAGERSGSRNGGGRTEHRRANPQGF